MSDDEVANYRFRVHVGGEKLGVMLVSGLMVGGAPGPYRLHLKRGVVRDDHFLLDWYRKQDTREIRVTVIDVACDALTFILREAKVTSIVFSDLDAGANQIFTETAWITYESAEIA